MWQQRGRSLRSTNALLMCVRCVSSELPSSAGRSLLSGVAVAKVDADTDGFHGRHSSTPRSALSDSAAIGDRRRRRRDCASADEQEAALNFSTRTPARSPPDCVADVRIKEEDEMQPQQQQQHPALYGLELGAGRPFDMSRSPSVAAAAAAVLGQYVDDAAVMRSLTSYDQQRLALYTSLMAAAAGGCDDGPPPPGAVSLLNGAAGLDGDPPPASLDHSLGTSYGDGLAMRHRLPAMRRRERFGHASHLGHQPAMKVRLLTTSRVFRSLLPSSHHPTRRNWTVLSRRVGQCELGGSSITRHVSFTRFPHISHVAAFFEYFCKVRIYSTFFLHKLAFSNKSTAMLIILIFFVFLFE